jgi:hypothetical protein
MLCLSVELLNLEALPTHERKLKRQTCKAAYNRKPVILTSGYLNTTELPTSQQHVSLNETRHVERTVSTIYM